MNLHAARLLYLGVLLAGCNAPARPARAPVTQVVLITVDTLRADRLGIYGYRDKPTSPALDAWAANAAVFERAYAPAPWTVPSIGALLTGRYPVEVGVYTNRGELDPDVVTLPELFRQHGFRTASFNTHYLLINEYGGFRRGFEHVHPVVAPPEDDSIHKIPFAAAEPALMEWLERHAQDPFFVWLHDMSPHEPASEGNPYLENPAWDRGSDWRAYDPEIRFMDELMERVLGKLNALGIAERALVVFTADHGEAFLEHDLAGHQDVMYDEVLHIPLVLRYPAMARPARIAAPVELFDVFRTIVELAGLPLPAGTRGESLLPLIEAGAAPRSPRHLFHARYHFEHGEHQLAVRDERWKLIVKTPPSAQRYDDRPLWGLHRPGIRFELYDLSADRGEQTNVIDAQTAVALRLQQALWAWHESTETPALVGPKRQPRELDAGTEEALRALGYDSRRNDEEHEEGGERNLSLDQESFSIRFFLPPPASCSSCSSWLPFSRRTEVDSTHHKTYKAVFPRSCLTERTPFMRRLPCSLVLIVFLAAPVSAADVKLETDDQKTLYALGLALSRNLDAFNLTADELATVTAGMTDGVMKKEPKVQLDDYKQKLQALSQARASQVAEAEKKTGEAFLTKMAAEKGAAKTDSGLIYIETSPGTGDSPKATDTVKVHYHGTLRDGTVFDSSVERKTPATFPLNRVIPCWTEGVQKMKVGGKAKLVCPANIAYGDRGAPPKIKPGAALAFDVELIEIVKVPTPAPKAEGAEKPKAEQPKSPH